MDAEVVIKQGNNILGNSPGGARGDYSSLATPIDSETDNRAEPDIALIVQSDEIRFSPDCQTKSEPYGCQHCQVNCTYLTNPVRGDPHPTALFITLLDHLGEFCRRPSQGGVAAHPAIRNCQACCTQPSIRGPRSEWSAPKNSTT